MVSSYGGWSNRSLPSHGDIPNPAIRRGIRIAVALGAAGGIAVASGVAILVIRWVMTGWVVSPWIALSLVVIGVALSVLGLRRLLAGMKLVRAFVSHGDGSPKLIER